MRQSQGRLRLLLILGSLVALGPLSIDAYVPGLPRLAAELSENHGERAGAASAVLGFGQYMIGGLAAPLVGLAGPDSALLLAITIAALGVGAIIALVMAPATVPDPA